MRRSLFYTVCFRKNVSIAKVYIVLINTHLGGGGGGIVWGIILITPESGS